MMAVQFREAAARSWADAENLTKTSRRGTPDHLYGVAAECALKAVLAGLGIIPMNGPPAGSRLRVHIDKLWNEYSMHVGGLAARTALLPPTANPFASWRIEHRYEEDATFTTTRLERHRSGAEQALAVLETARTVGVVR